ncbi:MAG: glucuronate isomerase [Alkalibacterium sp.]|nr:glucuronate isomerase [Alkalibacterium sp.]
MTFIHDDFMLQNDIAKHLYHDYAKDLPIFDYHCHLDPKQIAEDHSFENITELWLAGDHYKWRAMRANGVSEHKITGHASPEEKFEAWANTAHAAVGNPLFHWTQLELKKYFDIDDLLSGKNWKDVYDKANETLRRENLSARKLVEQSNVAFIGTTDNPTDSLKYHEQIMKDESFKVKVAPSFRPDESFAIGEETFTLFLEKLKEVTGQTADSYSKLVELLEERVEYFDQHGTLASDHGLSELMYAEAVDAEVERIYQKALNQDDLTKDDKAKYVTRLLTDLSGMYHKRGWIMQIHFGAIRNNNEQAFNAIGPDAGFDSIRDQTDVAYALNNLLNAMHQNGTLPKTIVYNLNPQYNHIVASTVANFQSNEEGIKGKVQFGAGWWFNDTEQGMLRQMETLADHGMLMHFVGMLTDSRSFISYPRHDYFRRILCHFVGEQVASGKFPDDESLLKELIENVSYKNAIRYFKK